MNSFYKTQGKGKGCLAQRSTHIHSWKTRRDCCWNKKSPSPTYNEYTITVHSPNKCTEWNKEAVNEKTVQSCRKWIISPQVGGLDEFGYIFKIICYFVHQASDWKDSFFQTDYIIKKILDKDCPLKKSYITSILEPNFLMLI